MRVVHVPVYQGPNSCSARREGVYVRRLRGRGVDTVFEAVALAYMCLRDLRRGYTWENGSCRRIKMTGELFEKRVRFIYTLSLFHGADPKTRRIIRGLVEYVLKRRRLPKTVPMPSGARVPVREILARMIVRRGRR